MKDIFKPEVVAELSNRLDQLTPASKPLWGKMNAAQMLAHCNVTYDMVFTNKHPKPNGFVRLLLKLFVKEGVVGPRPYKKSTPTAKQFLVAEQQDFEQEKYKLTEYLKLCSERCRNWFDGRESNSFGALNAEEWNVMFYKHLDHHLAQFGV